MYRRYRFKENSNGKSCLYNCLNKKGNRNIIAPNRGNIAPRIRGQGGRGIGHGSHTNAGKQKHGNRVPRALFHPPKAQGAKLTKEVCLIMSYTSLNNEKH
jgi:hypothetical protein